MKNGNDPYAQLDPAPEIRLEADFEDGGRMPLAQVSTAQGGEDRSPALRWEPVEGARSYLVSCYDPDAPTMSGFWHWVVADIPAEVTELAEGTVPDGATVRLNEALEARYIGPQPPAGHGPHRYFLTVSALEVPKLELPVDLTAARVHFMAREHVIARGSIHALWQNPEDAA